MDFQTILELGQSRRGIEFSVWVGSKKKPEGGPGDGDTAGDHEEDEEDTLPPGKA
jgi:hypothetical protein